MTLDALSLGAGAVAAGLLATPHCAAMCGGFAAACSAHRARAGTLAWHAGRLAGYALLGAIAGAMGRALPGPAWLPAGVAALLLVWSAASLAGLVRERTTLLLALVRPVTGAASVLARRPGAFGLAAFGFAIAFLPCGMVYAALGIAIASGGALAGMLLMLAFGIGTLPGLVVVATGLRRFAGASLVRRRLVAAGVLVAGLLVIGMRWSSAASGSAHTHHAPSGSARSSASARASAFAAAASSPSRR